MAGDRVQRGGEGGLRLEQDRGVEQAGRAGAAWRSARLVAQHDDRPPGAAEGDGVALGREHLQRHDVAVVPRHRVEVADEQRHRAHRGVGGEPIAGCRELFIHVNSINASAAPCSRRSCDSPPNDDAPEPDAGSVAPELRAVRVVAAERTDRGDRAAVVGAGLAPARDGVAHVVDQQRRSGADHDRAELEVAPLHREAGDRDDERHGAGVLVHGAREVDAVVDPDLDADDADEAVQRRRHAAEHARPGSS